MMNAPLAPLPAPSFFARLAALLSSTDQALAWYHEHRAWPANEPIRIREKRA